MRIRLLVLLLLPFVVIAQTDRWRIKDDGSIEWLINGRLPHSDHIEMGGEKVAMWMRYTIDSNATPSFSRTMVYPSYRLLPVRTIAHMTYNAEDNDLPRFFINDKILKAGVYNAAVQSSLPEKAIRITHHGIMKVESLIGNEGVRLIRSYFPSVDKPVAIEKMVFINGTQKPVRFEMEYLKRETRPATERTDGGPHSFVISTIGDGVKQVQPGDSAIFAILYEARTGSENSLPLVPEQEEQKRKDRINGLLSKLVLETPDVLLNTTFAFAKIRAAESIYNTKGGYMHGPGGLRYYAAIWANDQAEYINPFFAFLGDTLGNRSAMNSFRLFARYMNDEYKPIPSSIIAEGKSVWQGAKDRGDMAMIAYGAGRYGLAYGSKDSALVLWPLIEWCLEYLDRKLNSRGVAESNSDELEGRFPAGKANLNTSCLYYDALRSAVMLGKLLGKPAAQLKAYEDKAARLNIAIEKYFGATVEGYNTYRYYEGNDTLRAWIATPLVMDMFNRREGTLEALFSPRLWTEDGLATLAGDKTFWDRSTLYGLRGAFAAGATEKAMRYLTYFSRRRLLGEHVPYAVEAYPEGNQRHLSAESGLYCRIYTEGMFGIRPTGFRTFNMTPRLPEGWQNMMLRKIHAFGGVFDIKVSSTNKKDQLLISIASGSGTKEYTIRKGETCQVKLD
ncbi:hypothetical protein [Sediminibacterium ginsengisoli]|uniref:Glycogen debranching enzyme (Alpha-1,6-glucosidase) n=1 Tax=Sediminibacterium ginsengisoli TaxID=413434 RepID=A0A1T4KWM2_9BACT|nr:hypothetical protein [Sediminibacterium ginsengisoli]SJZ46770.1 hypothetical protein SAMN04488132_102158 [Sediminibacterium ginsengisoli]